VATFVPGRPITTEQPFIDVDAGLSVGTHRFQLVVVDAQGNRSVPDVQTVIISRLPVTPPIVGPIGPVIPIDPVVPIRPVSPIEPIQPIGTGIPTPVRSLKGAAKPQGRKRPRRGGTQ
jgi:hypothetical protein